MADVDQHAVTSAHSTLTRVKSSRTRIFWSVRQWGGTGRMNGTERFYRMALITLISFLLVNAFTHPKRDREFRTVFMVSETIWFFFLTVSSPVVGDHLKHSDRRNQVWLTVLFLYFLHTHEYVHPNYLE